MKKQNFTKAELEEFEAQCYDELFEIEDCLEKKKQKKLTRKEIDGLRKHRRHVERLLRKVGRMLI